MIDETPIKTTVEELRKLININNYVGEAIETEDKLLIPVSKATLGFGIGEQKKNGEITGTGAGISVEPVTMVVVTKGTPGVDGIRTINLSKGGEGNKALNELGLILTDIIKDIIPSRQAKEPYINVDDIDIQDGEINEKTEVTIEDAEEKTKVIIEDAKEKAEDIVEKQEEKMDNE